MDLPVLHTFVRELAESERFRLFLEELPETRARVSEPALPLVVSALHEELGRPLVILAPEDADARDIAEAAAWFLGDDRVALLPSRGVSWSSGLEPSPSSRPAASSARPPRRWPKECLLPERAPSRC